MELWIRSQDKKSLRIVSNINIIHEDGKTFICNYTGIANIKLGTYKTEQRALEVLDEIENLLNPKYLIRIDGNTQKIADFLNTGDEYIKAEGNGDIKNINNTFVYQMPEK